MAKTEKDIQEPTGKVIIEYDNEPLLEELGFADLIKKRQRHSIRAKFYETEKDRLSAELVDIIDSIDADSVLYTDSKGGKWTTNLTRGEKGSKLDLDKLKENLGKLGKLDAVLIAKIFEKSMVETAKKADYVTVYAPRKSKKNGKVGEV